MKDNIRQYSPMTIIGTGDGGRREGHVPPPKNREFFRQNSCKIRAFC